MTFTAQVKVMPLKELLDPQGKAVTESLHNLGLTSVDNVRIGKRVTLSIDAANEAEANEKTELACKKLLANQVMESYSFDVVAE